MPSATVAPTEMVVALMRFRGRYDALVPRTPAGQRGVQVGKGQLVEGPIRAVLLLTGRAAALLPDLSAQGVEHLT